MTYFNLYSYCYFVQGHKNSALYDTFTGRIFWIKNDYENDIINLSRQGNSDDQIADRINKPVKEVTAYFDILEKLDLGGCHNTPIISQKFRPIATKGIEFNTASHSPILEAVIEVSGDCSVNCNFCGFENFLVTSKCFCGNWSKSQQRINYDIDSVVKQLALYQTLGITLKGGDPFENRRDMLSIINSAGRYNIPVNIETRAKDITDADWKIMLNKQITLTQILFFESSDDAEQLLNSENNLISGIIERSIRIGALKIIVKVLLNPETFSYENGIKNYLVNKGFQFIFIDKYISMDKAQYSEEQNMRIKESLFNNSHTKFAVGIDSFLRLNKGHQCWQDRIAISMDGFVMPCIANRDKILGDVNKTLLLDILRENWSDEFEYATNKNYEPCNKCEFRYGCTSCTVMNMTISELPESKAWNCLYNPQEGQWEN